MADAPVPTLGGRVFLVLAALQRSTELGESAAVPAFRPKNWSPTCGGLQPSSLPEPYQPPLKRRDMAAVAGDQTILARLGRLEAPARQPLVACLAPHAPVLASVGAQPAPVGTNTVRAALDRWPTSAASRRCTPGRESRAHCCDLKSRVVAQGRSCRQVGVNIDRSPSGVGNLVLSTRSQRTTSEVPARASWSWQRRSGPCGTARLIRCRRRLL